jgi:predicted dehydrogenase
VSQSSSTSRREFLQASAVAGASLAALAGGVHAAGNDTLKVGLIGCGGRGGGAALQALRADKNVKLHALGDIFDDQLQDSLKGFKGSDQAAKVDVSPERCFIGFDAYKKVIDCCDVVLLTTPPHFRPIHLAHAIEKNKHVFCEKPMGIDVPGVKKVVEACQEAKKKGLSVVSGFCWRYDHRKRETFKRVHEGAIGDLVTLQCTYNTGYLRMFPRKQEWSDAEWQLRNWLYFTWLSGDHIVEQAVHSLDKMNWAMQNEPPVSATALGGRQVRTSPDYGHVFDHFSVVYEYKNGVKMFHNCRQQEKCANDVTDYLYGTRGVCDVMKHTIKNGTIWTSEAAENPMYQTEHDELFASIRNGKPINDGEWMTRSTLVAILGRTAAYTGQKVTWEQLMKANVDLTPKAFVNGYSFAQLPTPKVAIPGKTKVTDTLWA